MEEACGKSLMSIRLRIGVALAALCRPLPYFRGRHRALNALLPKDGAFKAIIFGAQTELDLSDYIQREVFIGSFEVEETKWVKDFLRPGMTFVDVGANIGYYVALASRLVGPRGSVIAFEPSPYAFNKLHHLVESNSIVQAACFPVALSDHQGLLTLYIPPHSTGNHNPNVIQGEDGSSAISVRARTLDSFVRELAVERIDLLKVDVEGYEPKVLEGAEESIRSGRIRTILSEFHPRTLAVAGSSPEILQNWLSNRGFRVIRFTPTNRLLVWSSR